MELAASRPLVLSGFSLLGRIFFFGPPLFLPFATNGALAID
jgi:hypothetical protein